MHRFKLRSILRPQFLVKSALALTAAALFAGAGSKDPTYYTVTYHDHAVLADLGEFVYSVVNKGRIQVFELKEGIEFVDLPDHLQAAIKEINLDVLSTTPVSSFKHKIKSALGLASPDPRIVELTERVTTESFRTTVTDIVALGTRTTEASVNWIMNKLTSYGYTPIHNYNIEAWKEGVLYPDEFVIILGHMDTVSNTVGADDNASGATGVLEAARILSDVPTERSILFLITEDEERGLLGAKRYVQQLRSEGRLAQVKFVVNMDMIAYNSNGIVDLETKPRFEDLTDWMADVAMTYTPLRPNKVLNAWGSDHVPFIDAGVPTLLTIEHWNTHTPCWHRTCDRLDTLNFEYARDIIRLNIAALSLKAGLAR